MPVQCAIYLSIAYMQWCESCKVPHDFITLLDCISPVRLPQDFVVWQCTPGQRLTPSVHRNISSTGPESIPDQWAWVWDTTAPCPANLQKPLQDPMVEGERVLHDLDTLDITDVTDTLLALGLTAVVHLLAHSQGACLPPIAQLCTRFHRCVCLGTAWSE